MTEHAIIFLAFMFAFASCSVSSCEKHKENAYTMRTCIDVIKDVELCQETLHY